MQHDNMDYKNSVSRRLFPFNASCSPLSYSGNPGVNANSHWETPADAVHQRLQLINASHLIDHLTFGDR